jgi:hypothetical protein
MITNTERHETLSRILDEIWDECLQQQNTLEWANEQFVERVSGHAMWKELPERFMGRLCEQHIRTMQFLLHLPCAAPRIRLSNSAQQNKNS